MADKADKIMKAVYDFMLKHNRPYSLNEIQNHTREGKTGITKALGSLVEEGKIIEKTYGKQKIYYMNQDLLEVASDDELSKVKEELKILDKKVKELTKTHKELEDNIKNINSLPSMAELNQKEQKLNQEIESYRDDPSQNTEITYDIAEFEKIKSIDRRVKAELRKRKSIVEEALDMILDHCDKPREELIEDIGLEFPEVST